MTQGRRAGHGRGPLSGFHVAQGQTQTLAVWLDEVARHEVPSFRSLSFKEDRFLLGLVVQRLDEALGRRSHVGGGVVSKGFAEQSEDEARMVRIFMFE